VEQRPRGESVCAGNLRSWYLKEQQLACSWHVAGLYFRSSVDKQGALATEPLKAAVTSGSKAGAEP